uniref:Zinc knuckle CX2CX4HX4C domain-containing protein n=1 Tax=Manihot esculenta TaxID=3983 RepID=A0A2C9WI76_MANES
MRNTLSTLWRPGGPWSFNNALLVTKRLAQGDDPLSVDLNTADFWGQLHQLPYGYANTGVATLLGNFIGAFLSYDSAVQGGECRGYVHIRVAVNVRLSFKRSKKVRAGNGAELVVQFRYERLPTFSFMCGKLGHSDRIKNLKILNINRIQNNASLNLIA